MPAGFVHAVVRPPRIPPAEAAADLRRARPWLALAGGPGIGWASDEFPVIFPAAATPDPLAELAGRAGWTVGNSRRLVATVRPTDSEPPAPAGGVVALRSFEVASADAEEFVELSQGAWPAFEHLYEARILGLFRGDPPPPSEAQGGALEFLLATWYASLAEWERSRGVGAAGEGDAREAARRFRRRREITQRTVVRVGVPL